MAIILKGDFVMFCVRMLYNHHVVLFEAFDTFDRAVDYTKYLGSVYPYFTFCISCD